MPDLTNQQTREAKERQAKRDRFAIAALTGSQDRSPTDWRMLVERAFAIGEIAVATSEKYLQDDLDTQLTGGADEPIPQPAAGVPERA